MAVTSGWPPSGSLYRPTTRPPSASMIFSSGASASSPASMAHASGSSPAESAFCLRGVRRFGALDAAAFFLVAMAPPLIRLRVGLRFFTPAIRLEIRLRVIGSREEGDERNAPLFDCECCWCDWCGGGGEGTVLPPSIRWVCDGWLWRRRWLWWWSSSLRRRMEPWSRSKLVAPRD